MSFSSLSAESIKLSNFQINLEKSLTPILERLKKCTELNFCEFSNDLEKERQNERSSLQAKIKEVLLEPLNCKILLMKNKELGSITDFSQFKKEMILIQDNIQNLKYENKKQVESLEKGIADLSSDLLYYNEKLLEWAEPIQVNHYNNTNYQRPRTVKSKHQCKEAKEFMDFVHSSGGHENGWRQEDHHLFVRFRRKFKNIDRVAQQLHEELPDISLEDIKQHEEWYKKYISLELKKRHALKIWQKQRGSNSARAKYSDIPSKIAATINVRPTVNVQEKLSVWKAKKEERAEFEKQIEASKRQKWKETEELRRKRNEELKLIVHEWKERKQTSEEQEIIDKKIAAEQEKRRRAMEANRLIKRFQSQDDLYILKLKQKRKSEQTRIVRSTSSHSAKRDPERLLKPTQQWINRVHDETPSPKFGRVVPLRCLPKLGVPEWRKKLDD
ncbi:hypothetical protein NQ315_009731 [Exocentrus adspersus]|uniref:Coiled-coil domain-containing protein 112 n=1 Tax=Exocentrus adspersus TaxID=1586481 RepID=A0AAV8WH33_9CUCU|nr:hypothetical protein NQ315_009731 [Exocentrus adspersus]